jgi:hypothetical protein
MTTTWTKETIYNTPDGPFVQSWMPPHYASRSEWICGKPIFTPEFTAALEAETSWTAETSTPRLLPEESEKFADPDHECPRCEGRGSVQETYRGNTTGVEVIRNIPCQCRQMRMFWHSWRNVPLRYRNVRLDLTKPSPLVAMPLKKQEAVLKLIDANDGRSMILQGPAKTGKTHLLIGLYRRALIAQVRAWSNSGMSASHHGAWRVNTSVWLEEMVRESTSRDENTPLPDLYVEKVTRVAAKGMRPRLFLEEIDKFKPSEFKLIKLFELVNAVYEDGGQIVATSNAPVETLAAAWGSTYGEPILRRLGEEPDGLTIQFTTT